MDTKEKKILNSYPSFFSNKKTEALETALKIFNEAFDEYAKKNNLTQGEIISFKKMVMETYLARKVELYLEHKSSVFSDYIDNAVNFATRKTFDPNDVDDASSLFYYRNKKHTVFHD